VSVLPDECLASIGAAPVGLFCNGFGSGSVGSAKGGGYGGGLYTGGRRGIHGGTVE
jgi:hypothetical protein